MIQGSVLRQLLAICGLKATTRGETKLLDVIEAIITFAAPHLCADLNALGNKGLQKQDGTKMGKKLIGHSGSPQI